jgi:hypothetical protein
MKINLQDKRKYTAILLNKVSPKYEMGQMAIKGKLKLDGSDANPY